MLIVCPFCASEYKIDPTYLRPAGRNVRCASCRETFFAQADAEPPEDPSGRDQDDGEDGGAFDGEEDGPSLDDVWADIEAQGKGRSGAGDPARDADGATVTAPEPAAGPARTKRSRGRKPRSKADAESLGARLAKPFSRVPAAALLAALLVVLPLLAVLERERIVRAAPEAARLYAAAGFEVNLRGFDFRDVTSSVTAEPTGDLLAVEGEIVNTTRERRLVPPIQVSLRDDTRQLLYAWSIEPPRAILAAGESTRFRARLVAPPAEARQVLVRFAPPDEADTIATSDP